MKKARFQQLLPLKVQEFLALKCEPESHYEKMRLTVDEYLLNFTKGAAPMLDNFEKPTTVKEKWAQQEWPGQAWPGGEVGYWGQGGEQNWAEKDYYEKNDDPQWGGDADALNWKGKEKGKEKAERAAKARARARHVMGVAKKAISSGNAQRREKGKATAVEASTGSRRAREDTSRKVGERAAVGARAACTTSAQDTMPHIHRRSEPT